MVHSKKRINLTLSPTITSIYKSHLYNFKSYIITILSELTSTTTNLNYQIINYDLLMMSHFFSKIFIVLRY